MSAEALDPETIRAHLERAQERRDRAWAEFEDADREVRWWEEGLRLFAPGSGDQDGEQLLKTLLPDGPTTRKPTLRQAMILVMRANPRSDWTTDQIASHLALNGWTPRQGDAIKRVSDTAGLMVGEGHLHRVGRGVYRLSNLLAGALERAFPPITDYRLAAVQGFPVPDHPAASEGLREE